MPPIGNSRRTTARMQGVTRLILLLVIAGLCMIAIVTLELARERLDKETTVHLNRLVNAIDSALSSH